MDVQLIQPQHIMPGIIKYAGQREDELEVLMTNAKKPSEVYLFKDGRVLLVNKGSTFGFLYRDKETFLRLIILE